MRVKLDRRTKILMDDAQEYADKRSGCRKVAVGSVILTNSLVKTRIFGANKTLPVNCRAEGCRREELYGENSKDHRLPSDCRAIHSEVDAITTAARLGIPTKDSTMYITRYPCEACARAIVGAKIRKVVYGRKQEISEETKKIFQAGNVNVEWLSDWDYEDVIF